MFLYLVNADLRCLLHIVANIFFLQFQLFCHPRRPMRTSASVGADVCVGRCGCLRRSVQNVLITLLVSTNSNKNRKEQNFDIEVLLFSLVDANGLHGWGTSKGVHLSQVHQPNRMLVNMVVYLYTVGAPLHGWCT